MAVNWATYRFNNVEPFAMENSETRIQSLRGIFLRCPECMCTIWSIFFVSMCCMFFIYTCLWKRCSRTCEKIADGVQILGVHPEINTSQIGKIVISKANSYTNIWHTVTHVTSVCVCIYMVGYLFGMSWIYVLYVVYFLQVCAACFLYKWAYEKDAAYL